MAWTWNEERAGKRIDGFLRDVETVTVKDFVRVMEILDLKVNVAYKVPAAHLYIDLLNVEEMLGEHAETETKHRRVLRFLNLHQRAVEAILTDCDALKVDFHNQRLHAVVTHPLGDDEEATRIHKAVTIAATVMELLAQVSDPDETTLPAPKVRVGIDSGMALAVTNGRRGAREPLFLGNPANLAAKMASGGKVGIYLTNGARATAGFGVVDDDRQKTTPLTKAQIATSAEEAGLVLDQDAWLERWEKERKAQPLSDFDFTRPTPPLRDFEATLDDIGPKQSRRIACSSVYADIDGFTAYVAEKLEDDAEAVVRALHVLRSELHSVLRVDFGGMKVRFIGDCLHGALAEGATVTDEEETVSTAVLAAAGMRSSFLLAQEKVEGIEGLGLAIGFDLGPAAKTRLGVRGMRNRVSLGRATLRAEAEQSRCDGDQTALGQAAYDAATQAVKALFGTGRRVADLTYPVAVAKLSQDGDRSAKAARAAAVAAAGPAFERAAASTVRPYAGDPA